MENKCSHNFEWSHKETQATGTTNFQTIDVVVCKKCGEVKRQVVPFISSNAVKP